MNSCVFRELCPLGFLVVGESPSAFLYVVVVVRLSVWSISV